MKRRSPQTTCNMLPEQAMRVWGGCHYGRAYASLTHRMNEQIELREGFRLRQGHKAGSGVVSVVKLSGSESSEAH